MWILMIIFYNMGDATHKPMPSHVQTVEFGTYQACEQAKKFYETNTSTDNVICIERNKQY